LKADNIFDYEYLMREEVGLIPCQIEEDGEDVIFKLEMEGMRSVSELKQEDMEYRFRFLQNFFLLKNTWQKYDLPMDEENIFFDYNFMPCVAVRDVKKSEGSCEDTDFFEIYQALAAGILCRKYTYSQIRESGPEIIRKDKAAVFVLSCETTEELHDCISEKAEEMYLVNKNEKVRLDKKGYQLKIRLLSGALALLALLLLYTGYQTFCVLPRDKAVIQASRAYTVQNYVDCIDKLKRIKPEQMDTYTKYILAVSYARSEALEKVELQNVLDRLSIYSNEIELEYWIAIGRADYALAENYAKALSDDKLLVYAYMKELNYLEGNVNMDGEEKQSRMNELSNAITEIGKKYTEE
ncbi:MAG: type VII secretion protein EssB/YukC, partial [Bacillota bacterium]|nr:type VII secretion protein EssB/YukC [Bacillota bacterium]